jgi:hypothetical protein
MYVCTVFVYMYICVYVCVYVCMYVYIHAHTDTYTHTQKWKKLMFGKQRASFNLPFPFNVKYSVLDIIFPLSP